MAELNLSPDQYEKVIAELMAENQRLRLTDLIQRVQREPVRGSAQEPSPQEGEPSEPTG